MEKTVDADAGGVAQQLDHANRAALALVLRLAPLSASDWTLVLGLALVPADVGQTVKVARV